MTQWEDLYNEKPLDILDEIEKELSTKNKKEISDEKEVKIINEDFEKLQDSIFKDFFKKDLNFFNYEF